MNNASFKTPLLTDVQSGIKTKLLLHHIRTICMFSNNKTTTGHNYNVPSYVHSDTMTNAETFSSSVINSFGGLHECRCPLQSLAATVQPLSQGCPLSCCPLLPRKTSVQLLSQGCPL